MWTKHRTNECSRRSAAERGKMHASELNCFFSCLRMAGWECVAAVKVANHQARNKCNAITTAEVAFNWALSLITKGFYTTSVIFLQHFLLGVKFILALVIPDVPQWVQDEMARQHYKDKLSLRVSSNEMERSPFYACLFPSNNFFFLSVEFETAVQFRNFRLKFLPFPLSETLSLSGPLFWSWSVFKSYHGNQTTRTVREHGPVMTAADRISVIQRIHLL